MKITLFGVRGTSPVTGAQFSRYGGDTTSLLVEGAEGEMIALDAGTGIRRLGERLRQGEKQNSLLVLMTHYHLDHIIGLPLFRPLYEGKWKITFAANARAEKAPEEIIPRILAQPFWPLQIEDLQARIDFRTLAGSSSRRPLHHGALRVRWSPLHHPGGCTAYRFDEPDGGASFVFATDGEWQESTPEEKEAFRRLCDVPGPPDLLIFDGQFGPTNYKKFRGWGHSSWADAVEVSRLVKAEKLLITHHAPENDDNHLDQVEAELKKSLPEARLGRAGMELSLENRNE